MRSAQLSDHESFVKARWEALVRSLVAEGVDPGTAESAVAEALASTRRHWARIARDEDADARVWADAREGAGLPARSPGQVAPGLQDGESLVRAAPVAVDTSPMLRVEERLRWHRHRVLRAAALEGAAFILVSGYLVWGAARSPAPAVVDAVNPAPVPWYSEGWLHLDEVAVALPDLDAFVPTGSDEVAYRDDRGRWFSVRADGEVVETAEPASSARTAGAGGFRASPDRRYVLQLAAGRAMAYDVVRDVAVDTGTGLDVRVLDASFAPDGSVTFVVSNVVERRHADAGLRLSQTGSESLRTCTLAPLRCGDVVRVSAGRGGLELR